MGLEKIKNCFMIKKLPLRKLISFASRGISPSYVEREGILVLNQKCIRNNKVLLELARLTDKTKKFSEEKKVQKFDILINSTGVGTLGRVAQLIFDIDATVDSHISIFRVSKEYNGIKIDPKYIGYSVRFKENEIEKLGKGATGQTELSKDSVLDDISIYFPDFSAQTCIASVLSTYDDLIENNEKRIKILEEMAERLYHEWFVKFKFPGHEKVRLVDSGTEYGEIPEGWEVKKIQDLYGTSSGGTPSRKNENEDEFYSNASIPWVKTKELNDNYILDTEEKITEFAVKKSSAKIFPKNTVLIAMYGATIGKLGILSQSAATNQACCAFLLKEVASSSYYIFQFLKNNTKKITNLAFGAAQPNISQNTIRNIDILKPSTNILELYNRSVDPIFNEILLLQRNNKNLSKTSDLLIPQLVTGRRKVK
jgi:type I restriction enzyme S subunit